MTDKTRHADDATLAYIAQLESQLAAANARLAGIVEECARVCDKQVAHIKENAEAIRSKWNDPQEGRARELGALYLAEAAQSIRALAPAVAEIPQPAEGVVVPRELLLECRDDVAEVLSRMEAEYGPNYRKDRQQYQREQLAKIDALLAATQETRK